MTEALLRSPDRSQALQLVAELAQRTAGADVAAVFLRDETGTLVVEAIAGVVADNLIGTGMPAGESALQTVLASGQPLVLDEEAMRQGSSGLELFEDGWPDLGHLPCCRSAPLARWRGS